MLELCGVKTGELIPATHFTPLSYWLQARQTLSAQSAPTLTSLQGRSSSRWKPQSGKRLSTLPSRNWQVTPQTTLSAAQILALLNKVFVLRVARARRRWPSRWKSPRRSERGPLSRGSWRWAVC
jgi:hypothetical protein